MNTALTRRRARLGLRGTKFLLSAGFLAASIQLARTSETPTLIERPNANSGPTQVSVQIWFVDINNIDSAQQSFTADISPSLRPRSLRSHVTNPPIEIDKSVMQSIVEGAAPGIPKMSKRYQMGACLRRNHRFRLPFLLKSA